MIKLNNQAGATGKERKILSPNLAARVKTNRSRSGLSARKARQPNGATEDIKSARKPTTQGTDGIQTSERTGEK